MFCNYCGHELDSNNKCHNTLCPSLIDDISPLINTFSENEMITFIGYRNTNYYLDKFSLHKEESKFISWNPSAFIFHWLWLFYRKMNTLASIYLLTYFIALVFLPPIYFILLGLAGHILCGLYGTSIYKNHCIKKLYSIKSLAQRINPNSYVKMIQYHGGTNLAMSILMSFVYSFILAFILIFLVNYSISYLDYPSNFENPFYYNNEDEQPYWYNTSENFIITNNESSSYI